MVSSLRIGTRGSKLALWQAHWLSSALVEKNPNLKIDLQVIKTEGDKRLDVTLDKIGGKGLFIKEIEESLFSKEIDIAVHSLKDMPAHIPTGLVLAAVPEREECADAFISRSGVSFEKLPAQSKIGTSSLRRRVQLQQKRPDLHYVDLRGNIDTRLQKLQKGEFEGIVLAKAGLKRLGLESQITQVLDLIPAVGQGALALECRQDDLEVLPLLKLLNDDTSFYCVQAEREFLKLTGGNCFVPLGCHVSEERGCYQIKAFIGEKDGSRLIVKETQTTHDQLISAIQHITQTILDEGGRGMLAL